MILTNLLTRLFSRAPAKPRAGIDAIDELLRGGYQSQQAGHCADAERSYRTALGLDGRNADAHYLLGALLGETGNYGEAAGFLDCALALKEDFADAHAARGNVHLMLEDRAAARASYERALCLDPRNAVACFNLGLLLQAAGAPDRAFECFGRAYALNPEIPDLLKNLILAHVELSRYDEARVLAERALARDPDRFEALSCIGLVMQKIHRPLDALPYYSRALEINDSDPELLNNFGIVMQDLGRLDEAVASYDAAASRRPGFALAIWHRSLAYLLRQDFARAWPDYELRLKSKDAPLRPLEFPRWDGASVAGKRVLVYGEQGLGDEIMFASCLPDLIAAGAHCIVECSPKLETILRRSFPAATVYAANPDRAVPVSVQATGVDLQSAIGSLPLHLRRSRGDFPAHRGYLQAAPELILSWQHRLAALGPGLKVGIAWQGGTYKSRRPMRSLPLEQWLPILRTNNVQFVDLQYTDCSAEIEALRTSTGARIHSWPEVRTDYEQTAALVASLDLVISVCTAVIHLGGALGRPVWVIAPYSPEWRYGIAGEDMPWYPSVRVFRQKAYGDWDTVVEQAAQRLREKMLSLRGRDAATSSQQLG